MKTCRFITRAPRARCRAAVPRKPRPACFPVCFVERLEARIAPAYSASITGGVVTFTGDGADDTLTFTTTTDARTGDLVLTHNRFSAGDRSFASDTDLDSNTVGIQSIAVSALTMVSVNAGAGDDIVNLGDDRSPASALKPAFVLDGGGGANAIVIDWKSDVTGRVAVVTGVGITGINEAGGGAWSIASFKHVGLFGGSGDDTFDVRSGPSFAPVTILGGAGADFFTITGAADGSVFQGGPGSDIYAASKFEIGPIDLTINFNEETEFIDSDDEVKILSGDGNDSFALTPGAITVGNLLHFKHTGMERLAIEAGAGDDVISDNGELVPAVLDGQAGSDSYLIGLPRTVAPSTIAIDDTGAGSIDRLTVTGSPGDDTFTVGGARLVAGDSSNAQDSIALTLNGLESLSALGGGGVDRFHVLSTAAGTSLLLDGGDGSDTFEMELPLLSGKVTLSDHEFVPPVPGVSVTDKLTVIGSDSDDDIVATDRSIHDAQHTVDFIGIDELDILAGKGDDHVQLSTGALLPAVQKVRIAGGEGDDTIRDSSRPGHGLGAERAVIAIILEGDEGDDVLKGGELANVMSGGPGNDVVNGGAGKDLLSGGNFVTAAGGVDDVDVIIGSAGRDTVVEGGDFDWLISNRKIMGGGMRKLSGIERVQITGGAGGNRIDASHFTGETLLDGAGGNDMIFGGRGHDVLIGGLGDDLLDGGGGKNEVSEVGDVDFTLAGGLKAATLDGLGHDILMHIALVTLTGGASNNTIDANTWAGKAVLIGLGGDDILTGGFGNDVLIGGDGDDVLNGGPGKNTLTQ